MAKVYRFELLFEDTDNGQEELAHVHYQTDVPIAGSEPSAAEVLDHIMDHYSSSGHNMNKWLNAAYNVCQLTECRVREEVQPGSGDVPAEAAESVGLPGNLSMAGGSHTPSGLSVWQAFRTGAAIRSARGGTHIPGPFNVAALDTVGKWSTGTGFWTAVVALAASIEDKLDNVFQTTGDINPGVYSRTRRARGFDPFFFELDEVIPSTEPRWLRRRSPA